MLFMLSGNTLKAQLANLPCTGFNADVVADGTGLASTSTSTDVDGVGYVFVSTTFNPGSGICQTGTAAWPSSNQVTSLISPNPIFTLKAPNVNNVLRGNGTLTLVNPVACNNLYVLATGGSGAITVTATVTFSDLTTQVISGSVADWCSGTSPATTQFYRISRNSTAGTCDGGMCQYMYQMSLAIDAANQSKNIASVSFVGTGGVLNIFSLAGYTLNSPYLAATPTSLAFNYVQFGNSSTPQSFTLAGGILTANGTITLTAPTGYALCLTSGGTYTSTLPVTYTGTTLPSTTIYVKFTPTAANTPYNGSIIASGGGVSSYSIAVTGTSQLIYCTSASYSASYDNISKVIFGGINNLSGASTYSDYTTSVSRCSNYSRN